MTTAWILMTAMPPTLGHLHLIQFARHVADRVHVIVCTQPGEPYAHERVQAVRDAASRLSGVTVSHLHRSVPQGPQAHSRFWEFWVAIMAEFGMRRGGDLIVASEPYGLRLAQESANEFMPYDIDRVISPVHATQVRSDPIGEFRHIIPEFQSVVRQRVTIIGAESTGKTTLACDLAERIPAHVLPEWARPYLELLPSPHVDEARMQAIWHGQRALQRQGGELVDRPFVIQDTDLFATLGFWRNWNPATEPPGLAADALTNASDLYLVTRSTIPFEADPLRYGGHERETSDEYWVDLLESFGLNYRVLESSGRDARVDEAAASCVAHHREAVPLAFNRTRAG